MPLEQAHFAATITALPCFCFFALDSELLWSVVCSAVRTRQPELHSMRTDLPPSENFGRGLECFFTFIVSIISHISRIIGATHWRWCCLAIAVVAHGSRLHDANLAEGRCVAVALRRAANMQVMLAIESDHGLACVDLVPAQVALACSLANALHGANRAISRTRKRPNYCKWRQSNVDI